MIDAKTYKAQFSVTDEDLENVRFLGQKMMSDLPTILNQFYDWMRTLTEFAAFFSNEEHVKHVKAMQEKHWHIFFGANVDESYIQFRKRVGAAHARIGLPLNLYCRSAVIFNDLFIELFNKYEIENFRLLHSFSKLVNLDTSIVIETYNQITEEIIREQSTALMQLSTPVTQLWHDILLLPLVGIVDSRRAQDIMSTMLQKVSSSQARAFILDISGVAVVDTAVANHLIKITKATKLMGCRTIISGISPAVAQTIVELGIHIDEIMTTSSMQDALKESFRLTNTSNILDI